MDLVKIRTKKGRIITLTILKKTSTHILGDDLYHDPVIIPLDEIDSMLPVSK